MTGGILQSMKRMISLLLAAAMTAALLGGCQSGRAEEQNVTEQNGEERTSVVIAMGPTSEPEAGFDPAYGWGAGEHVHEPLIQSTLTVTNTDLTIGYDLATGYSVSEDGLTWTVMIRDDVSFTDGEPLTAEDVAFTYNTVKEASSVNDFHAGQCGGCGRYDCRVPHEPAIFHLALHDGCGWDRPGARL